MAITLNHTIVPAHDKQASAEFFAAIFGLSAREMGHFVAVRVNDTLTLDFDVRKTFESHHYAFHVSDAEFEAILGRVRAKGLPYGSGPDRHTDRKLYRRRGGRGLYFEDPYGHLLEVMTVPETGS